MDSLLEAIRAAPDDDEPRLVWADREGGERGELVVLQCQIAARAGTRADRVRMQARVRELLPKFARPTERFARGFAESVEVELDDIGPALFERSPALRELRLERFTYQVRPTSYNSATPAEAWAESVLLLDKAFASVPPGRLRSLVATPEIHEHGDYAYPDDEHPFGDAFIAWVAGTPALAGVTALRLLGGGFTEAASPDLARQGIEWLCGGSDARGPGLAAIVRAVPTLRRFGPWGGRWQIPSDDIVPLLEAPETLQLRELDLWGRELEDAELLRIAAMPFAHLERLGVGGKQATDRGFAALAASPHLAGLIELEMYTDDKQPASPAAFLRAPFALQRLHLATVTDDMLPALEAAPALEHLIVPNRVADRLRATIPRVNDEGW